MDKSFDEKYKKQNKSASLFCFRIVVEAFLKSLSIYNEYVHFYPAVLCQMLHLVSLHRTPPGGSPYTWKVVSTVNSDCFQHIFVQLMGYRT